MFSKKNHKNKRISKILNIASFAYKLSSFRCCVILRVLSSSLVSSKGRDVWLIAALRPESSPFSKQICHSFSVSFEAVFWPTKLREINQFSSAIIRKNKKKPCIEKWRRNLFFIQYIRNYHRFSESTYCPTMLTIYHNCNIVLCSS